MKVLLINGSPNKEGNTYTALNEMVKVFEAENIETEIVQAGSMVIPGCRACQSCMKTGRCVQDDIVNEIADKLDECDGLVIGSPVYYASANGTVVALLDRLFYSMHKDLRTKVGASLAIARRGGTTSAFDVLNKYFGISGMPVAGSQYWNIGYGTKPGSCVDDGEGMQTMRACAQNMVFLMKCIADGKEKYGLPEMEKHVWTNFIR